MATKNKADKKTGKQLPKGKFKMTVKRGRKVPKKSKTGPR